MPYYAVALRQVRDCFTWHAEAQLKPGARVVVPFRNKERIGIVVEVSNTAPDFKTESIKSVLDSSFLPEVSINLAWYLHQQHFTPLAKILTLMVPESFWLKKAPEKYDTLWQLQPAVEIENLRHPTAKSFYAYLQNHQQQVWESELPASFKNTFKTFVKNQYLKISHTKLVSACKASVDQKKTQHQLTETQKTALEQLKSHPQGSLLWGVTGSGKTEIYKRYFQALSKQNTKAQFLLLLPEIALTPQLIADFKSAFGSHVGVWHSQLNAGEKTQTWAQLQSGDIKILIGTRSASLIPIPQLSAIVVDEEHEWTFKNEFNPRFWTHEIVEFLAEKKQIPYIYGSATPKLRTYHLAQTQQLQTVELNQRVHQTKLPTIELVDLTQESKRGNFSPLSGRLKKAISQTLEQGKQVVLFLNKRGYAGATLCKFCGEVFHCDHCDMALKMHQQGSTRRLICHTCGFMKAFPQSCPSCKKTDFVLRGWGTQQLEAQLKEVFPNTTVFRADKDSITGRYDFENLLKDFKQTPCSILLGTQMIAKGLDLADVALVGVVLADVGLHLPDYSAEERVYQLLEQVSGRAGRRHSQGHIVVQSYQADLPLFEFLQHHNTQGFMAQKYAEHKKLNLPPLSYTAKVIISDKNKAQAFAACKALHSQLIKEIENQKLSSQVSLNWAPAFFPKLHGKYWFYIFLKSDQQSTLNTFMQNVSWPENIKIDMNPASLI